MPFILNGEVKENSHRCLQGGMNGDNVTSSFFEVLHGAGWKLRRIKTAYFHRFQAGTAAAESKNLSFPRADLISCHF